METLLFPTDFSDHAHRAIDYALSLYGQSVKKVIFLHATYLHHTIIDIPAIADNMIAERAKQALKKEADQLVKNYPNLSLSTEVVYAVGDLAKAIEEMGKSHAFDLVVMGTKGAHNLIETLVGSRTTHVIENISYPILVVPIDAAYFPPKTILFASDYHTFIKAEEMQPLVELAKVYNSKVNVLHVAEKQEAETIHSRFIKSELGYDLLDIDAAFKTIEGDNAAEGIDRYLDEHPADLLFMVTNKGGLFQKVFHKSVTKRLALHTHLPMLIAHHQKL